MNSQVNSDTKSPTQLSGIGTATELASFELSETEFDSIAQMLYRWCGIKLSSGKEGLVKSRLMKRLRKLDLNGFAEYISLLSSPQGEAEIPLMIDALTTNKTSFFREEQHFEFLRENVLRQRTTSAGRLRIWSAGCSSGEEPYSIAILLREEIPDNELRDVKILATDISTRILERARAATYDKDAIEGLPASILQKCFTCLSATTTPQYQVKENIRSLVRLARLNLMGPWPMKGPFDVIFCRNVMIYFDKPTQQNLVHRYWQLLRPGGYLFVGHSESLTSSSKEFRYVQPAVYMK